MAEYRYNVLASEAVEWKSATGVDLKVTVELKRAEMDYFGGGDWKPTRDGLAIVATTYIGGKEDQCGAWLQTIKGAKPGGVVASIGKIGVRAEQAEQIKAAYAAINAHPEMAAKRSGDEASRAADAKYLADTAAIERAMTLGGRSN